MCRWLTDRAGRPWRYSNLQSNDMRCGRIPATAEVWLTNPLQTGSAPDGKPPGQVRLPLQVAADDALHLQFERVVAALAGQRGERVERAPLVQVDEGEAALLLVPEGDQGAEQLRPEAVVHQRGVDRMQVGDQRFELVRHARADQPGEAVVILGRLDRQAALGVRAGVEQVLHVLLDVGEGPALARAEADRAGSSALESGPRVPRH